MGSHLEPQSYDRTAYREYDRDRDQWSNRSAPSTSREDWNTGYSHEYVEQRFTEATYDERVATYESHFRTEWRREDDKIINEERRVEQTSSGWMPEEQRRNNSGRYNNHNNSNHNKNQRKSDSGWATRRAAQKEVDSEASNRWDVPTENLESRSWEPAPAWKSTHREEQSYQQHNSHGQKQNTNTKSGHKGGKHKKNFSRQQQHPQRDWKNEGGGEELNNWTRRDYRSHDQQRSPAKTSKNFNKRKHTVSRSKSPAEPYFPLQDRSRTRSRSPDIKRQRQRSRSPEQRTPQTLVFRKRVPREQDWEGRAERRRDPSDSSPSISSRSPSPEEQRSLHRLPTSSSQADIHLAQKQALRDVQSQTAQKNGKRHNRRHANSNPPTPSVPGLPPKPSFMPPPAFVPNTHAESIGKRGESSNTPLSTAQDEDAAEHTLASNATKRMFRPIGSRGLAKRYFDSLDEEDASSPIHHNTATVLPIRSPRSPTPPPPPPAPPTTTESPTSPQHEDPDSSPRNSMMSLSPIQDEPIIVNGQIQTFLPIVTTILPNPPPIMVQPQAEIQGQDNVYEIIGQVGEGTFGQVYKAHGTRSRYALKRIRMESERDGFPVTAMREIKLLQSLDHPNVIRLYEMLVSHGSVFMVFEYMDHDLTGILSQSQFTFTSAHLKSLCYQMLAGLDYLHSTGIIHRDIKGSNILVNRNGLLKLADFGLARFYQKRRRTDYTNRVITLWYRPPELLFGATVYGPEVDMWSAGCIMLELFTKKPVFQGNDEIHQLEVIYKIFGTPTIERWPTVVSLPWYELIKPRDVIANNFRTLFAKWMTPAALDLAERLLDFNPEQRWTATQAMDAPYFRVEAPPAQEPTGLVQLDSEWHELETKREREKAKKRRKVDVQH